MTADHVFAIAVLVMVAGSFYFAPRIASARIVMQWRLDGTPSWSAPKWLGLCGLIVFALVVRGGIWAAMTWTPGHVHDAELGILLMSMVVAASHLYVLGRAARG